MLLLYFAVRLYQRCTHNNLTLMDHHVLFTHRCDLTHTHDAFVHTAHDGMVGAKKIPRNTRMILLFRFFFLVVVVVK